MKIIIKTPALLAAMICATLTSNATQAQSNETWGLISPTISTYSDNDQFKAVKAGIGLLPLYKDGQHFTGIQALHHSFEQYEWKKDASQVSLVSESINPKNADAACSTFSDSLPCGAVLSLISYPSCQHLPSATV